MSGRDAAVRGLTRALARPGRILLVTDFDGTLSPIVPEPGDATILRAARTALRRLAGLAFARPERLSVCVLSGRGAPDLVARVRVGGVRYVGNHGAEWASLARGSPAARLALEPDSLAELVRPTIEALIAEVPRRLGQPAWLLVEDKTIAVGFHYRRADRPDQARAAIERAAAEALDGALGGRRQAGRPADGSATVEPAYGRRVIEYRAAGLRGKAGAMEGLIEREQPTTTIVLGDDRTDVDAFDVVAAWRRATAHDGLIVGVSGAGETPVEVAERADVMLSGPADAAWLLGRIARRLAAEDAPS